MILCGWCGRATPDGDTCAVCNHIFPTLPYTQRGLPVPVVDVHEGRPTLVPADIKRRFAVARAALERAGKPVTIESMAEQLDVSPRTVRRWREKAS